MDVKSELQKAQRRAENWHTRGAMAEERARMFLELHQFETFKKYLLMAKYSHVRCMKQIKVYENYRKQDKYYTIVGAVFCTLVVISMGLIIYKATHHG